MTYRTSRRDEQQRLNEDAFSKWEHPFSGSRQDEYVMSARDEAIQELNEHLERKSKLDGRK